MKRISCICIVLFYALNVLAITQEGMVRTIVRKNQSGMPVEGVIIRVQGSHNKVESRPNGAFSLLLYDLQNGEPYAIASIVKSGYEPAQQELIGKRLPCSDQVPLEILLVSQIRLIQEREEIEAKARENVEKYYQTHVDSLEQLLAAKQISLEEMNKQKQRLESQYENFEPLLKAMSDILARTDYQHMDSLTLLMQQAVENGDPDEVERLMQEKGSIEQREAILREWRKNIDALQQQVDKNQAEYCRQKRQFEDDCYRMYAACLTRFQNDSACRYIQIRAASDTLNVDYQLQAGQFVRDIMANKQLAKKYFERAYRICQTQYDEFSGQMATTSSEIGLLYKQQRDLESALEWYQRSLTIREKIRGKNSPAVAEALNNIGELYRAKKDFKRAETVHKRALKIREKYYETNSLEVAESRNNIAGIYYQQGKFHDAEQVWKEVLDIYSHNPKAPLQRIAATTLNLGGIYFRQNRYEEAVQYFEQAVTLYTKVLRTHHPDTQNALRMLNFCRQKIQTLNQ